MRIKNLLRFNFYIVTSEILIIQRLITSNLSEKQYYINDRLTHEAITDYAAMNRIPIHNKIARVSHIMARLINFLEEQ